MSSILRISEAASLALHTVVLLTTCTDQLVSTREIARILHASEAHLSKVLQRLARVGLVKSIRGPRGGFTLNKSPQQITLLNIYEAIEGPLTPSSCLNATPVCSTRQCILGTLLIELQHQVSAYLAKTIVAKLSSVFNNSLHGSERPRGQTRPARARL